ncbi:MAG: sigma-70 family RNA polymerase sigma factor [Acidobacteria bacterium]|nr:sigma-70 family RNA polymerase sigma factor [Acidobacteriota bacterium]
MMKKSEDDLLSNIPEPVTVLIGRVKDGDAVARDHLWQIFFPLLKKKADICLRGNNVGAVMNPSDLVQDAALVLLKHEALGWNDRAHLYAFAATVMRHIVIDRARKHVAGNRMMLPIDELTGQAAPGDPTILEIDQVLNQLASVDPLRAKVVELRFFGGLTNEEIAHVTDISVATVKRYMTFSRAFIIARLNGQLPPEE